MSRCWEQHAKTLVAVVTGRHPFDVRAFHEMIRSIPEADCYIQHMEEFASSPPEVRESYDGVLFYNYHTDTPTGEEPWYEVGMKSALEQLGKAGQGLFLLHHALLAFPRWPLWSEIVGIEDRSFSFHHGQTIRVEIAQADHPITAGLEPWEMVDETYLMKDAGPGCEVLLTVDHPRSARTVGWTRQYRASRVFCLQLGHGATAYGHPSFREVVARGVRWCAGR